MKQLITILLLSSFLLSCNKSADEDEFYTVTGQVLDLDSKLPIAGAKAYLADRLPPSDSAITDASGRVSFRFKIGDPSRYFYVVKDGYLRPKTYWVTLSNVSRTDTFFLARPSFVNVTVSKTGIYLSSDTVEIQVFGDNIPSDGESPYYRTFHRDKANAPDKLYNLFAAYNLSANYSFWNHFLGKEKLYFRSEIIRNGSVLSTKTDSTNIIQLGTQNFTLNY
ncbi:MAG: hypothetical protein ABIO79_08035 [Ferruginibacter sp.]